MRKNVEPELNIKYSFRLPNGQWHHFAFTGEKTSNGRLVFINTTYGSQTTMTPARFSYLLTKAPHRLSEYVLNLDDVVNTLATIKESAAEETLKQQTEEAEKNEKKFGQIIFKLKTLPIEIEYTIEKECGIRLLEFCNDIKTHFGLAEAETLNKISGLLQNTRYALPTL